MYKVITQEKGKKTVVVHIVNKSTGEIYTPKFLDYNCPEDYINDNVVGVEPMTAKSPLNDAELEKMLDSTDYIAEEKLDGTRCIMHLLEGGNRLFSRRISTKTNWYSENTDSVPHLRDLNTPEKYYGTVLDGEMRIDGREFKDVSSTLNCTYDEAILRQTELGFITYHVFDIVYFCGVYVAKLPLIKRKALVKQVVNALDFGYVQEEPYSDDLVFKRVTPLIREYLKNNETEFENKFPELYGCLCFEVTPKDILNGTRETLALPKRAWYEYIILHGGEGLMLKDKQGTYKHTRGREYTKLKKFDTWDVVILDFLEPTREYTGTELATWSYWEGVDVRDNEDKLWFNPTNEEKVIHSLTPVTKHYFHNMIGTVKYGVIITDEELVTWKKKNPKETPEIKELYEPSGNEKYKFLVVGECSGMNEDIRQYMTDNQKELIGTVMEVGANEILKTGKLRHPRFIRFRNDKEAERCIWKDHLR